MKSWPNLILLVLLAVAVAGFLARRSHGAGAATSGQPAPALELADTEGRVVSLADLRGQVVAVNFWASWCPPCRQEIPDLAQIYAAHHRECFELLGVAEESGGRDEVVQAARKLGISYPILLDAERKAGEAFRVPAYPRTYLIDAQGRIRSVFRGAVDREEFERALAPLLDDPHATCPRA